MGAYNFIVIFHPLSLIFFTWLQITFGVHLSASVDCALNQANTSFACSRIATSLERWSIWMWFVFQRDPVERELCVLSSFASSALHCLSLPNIMLGFCDLAFLVGFCLTWVISKCVHDNFAFHVLLFYFLSICLIASIYISLFSVYVCMCIIHMFVFLFTERYAVHWVLCNLAQPTLHYSGCSVTMLSMRYITLGAL